MFTRVYVHSFVRIARVCLLHHIHQDAMLRTQQDEINRLRAQLVSVPGTGQNGNALPTSPRTGQHGNAAHSQPAQPQNANPNPKGWFSR